LKYLGIILLIVGVLIVAFVLLASPLGIMGSGFGIKHVLGVVVGAVVLATGIFLAFIRKLN
jgi:hypothetical protein